jgi:hypothetical protein
MSAVRNESHPIEDSLAVVSREPGNGADDSPTSATSCRYVVLAPRRALHMVEIEIQRRGHATGFGLGGL